MSYDPKKTSLSVAGHFVTGFGDEDTEIEFSEEDAVTEHIGIKGEHSFTEQTDDHGMIKFTIKSSSVLSMRILEGLLESKVEFPVLFKDLSDSTPLTVISDIGRIKNRPNRARGKEENMVEWMIAIPHLNPATV